MRLNRRRSERPGGGDYTFLHLDTRLKRSCNVSLLWCGHKQPELQEPDGE